MSKKKSSVLYIMLTIFSLAFIFIGNCITSNGAQMFLSQTNSVVEQDIYIARVDAVLSTEKSELELGSNITFTETRVKFSCTVLFGERKGDNIIAIQGYDTISSRSQVSVKQGDWVTIYLTPASSSEYYMGDFFRLHFIIIVAVVFFILLIVFAKFKGLSTIVALLFSMLAVFLVFIPAILSGRNIYFWAAMICFFTITINPYFIGGFNIKSTASALGCAGGVTVAALITILLNSIMNITGAVDEDMMMVSFIRGADDPIDLRAVTFAAVLIGALGATIDVSMSISSAISEMRESSEKSTFSSLLKYGMTIGRDIIGAQTSTLVLAYIGGALSVTLLLVTYQTSLLMMLNLELIIVELLQMLIGGFVVLFTIPATAFICALMLDKKDSGGHSRHKKSRATYRIGH